MSLIEFGKWVNKVYDIDSPVSETQRSNVVLVIKQLAAKYIHNIVDCLEHLHQEMGNYLPQN